MDEDKIAEFGEIVRVVSRCVRPWKIATGVLAVIAIALTVVAIVK